MIKNVKAFDPSALPVGSIFIIDHKGEDVPMVVLEHLALSIKCGVIPPFTISNEDSPAKLLNLFETHTLELCEVKATSYLNMKMLWAPKSFKGNA